MALVDLVAAADLAVGAADPIAATRTAAERLEALYGALPAEDILVTAIGSLFPGRIALVSSFGADAAVLLHLVAEVAPATPVIFLDTGKHFPETLRHRDKLVSRLGLTDVRSVKPDPARLGIADPDEGLWLRNPDLCCRIRKVEPLARALHGFDAWITGRKRFQGALRSALPAFEADATRIKINPLATWSKADVEAYAAEHDLPAHPLVAQGFRSIGCMPCTDRVADGEDERAGRWRGSEKTECGIHLGIVGRETDGSGI
jgi:phosphoadenosine phosphosulfate reductase